ncbi:MAG: MFS transporter, partial [Akkermansiaceae bacterium]|nr:MFS transporter [Akkermansiaceae bacterium]
VFFLFFNWFFFYLVDVRGFTAQQAGGFTAAQWIVGAVGATIGGLACDRLGLRLGVRRGYRLLAMAGLFLTA